MSSLRIVWLRKNNVLIGQHLRRLSTHSSPTTLVKLLSQIPEYKLKNASTFSQLDRPRSSHTNFALPQAITPNSRPNITHDKAKVVSGYEQDVGKLFVDYFTSKVLLSQHPSVLEESKSEISKALISNLKAEIDTHRDYYDKIDIQSKNDILSYVGSLALSNQQSCVDFLSRFVSKDTNEPLGYTDLFALTTPKMRSTSVDYSPFKPRVLKGDALQLPGLLDPESKFHPFYFMGTESINCSISSEETNQMTDTHRSLSNLTNHGKYVFEWYTINCILKGARQLGHKEARRIALLRSKASMFVQYSRLNRVLPEFLNINDEMIFFRYLALLDLHDICLDGWFEQAIQVVSQRDQHLSKDLTPFKNRRINLVPLQHFNIDRMLQDNILELGKIKEDMRGEIEILGDDFMLLVLTKCLLKVSIDDTDFDSCLWGLLEAVKRSIDSELKKDTSVGGIDSSNLNSSSYIGVFSLTNSDKCEEFISSLVDIRSDMPFDETLKSLKYLMFKTRTPRITSRSITIPDSSEVLRLPLLHKNDNITNMMLVNCSLIVPTDEGDWLHDRSTKNCLVRIRNLGKLLYKTKTKQKLITTLPEGTMEYFKLVDRLLNNNQLFNFLLRKSKTFSLLEHQKYQSLLLRKRFNSDLHSSQFAQYVTCLYLEGSLDNWVSRLSHFLINCIQDLSHEEVLEFVSSFNRMIYSTQSSMSDTYKEKCLSRIDELKLFESLQHVSPPSNMTHQDLNMVGEKYVTFVINKLNVNYGLDAFLSSKQEMVDIFQEISTSFSVPKTGTKHSNFFQYLAMYMFEHGEEKCEALVHDLFGRILNKKWKAFDERIVDRIKANAHSETHPSPILPSFMKNTDELSRIPISSQLDKLLLINYNISKSFLKSIKSNSRNPYLLPDICTKFNSIGNAYYEFCVVKNVYAMKWDKETQTSAISLLLDRKFTSILAYSLGLGDAFSSPRYVQLSSNFMKNSYFTLRFYNQAFNQYIGLLEHRESSATTAWIESLCHCLRDHLESSQKPKVATIRDLKNEINDKFKNVSP